MQAVITTWCLACSGWEALGAELGFQWSQPALRYARRDSLVQAGLPRSNGPGGWVHTSRTLTHHSLTELRQIAAALADAFYRADFPEDLGAETLAVLARTFGG